MTSLITLSSLALSGAASGSQIIDLATAQDQKFGTWGELEEVVHDSVEGCTYVVSPLVSHLD